MSFSGARMLVGEIYPAGGSYRMPFHAGPYHPAFGQFQGGEQGFGTVARVIVGHGVATADRLSPDSHMPMEGFVNFQRSRYLGRE